MKTVSTQKVNLDIDKLKNLLGGMAGRMASFAQGKFGKVFNTCTPEVTLTDIILQKQMLYIMLPTMGKDTAALNLGKMVMSDLRSAVASIQALPKDQRPNPPFIVFADEMGSYVMPGIARLFEQARSANICMIPAFQSFANLSVVGPDFASMIVQNTWNKIFFKFGDDEPADKAAAIIGKHVIKMKTESASESESSSSQMVSTIPQAGRGGGTGLSVTLKEQEAFRVEPDTLKSLGIGEAVTLIGSDVYYINTPMLTFDNIKHSFKVTRYDLQMPAEETALNLEANYDKFITKEE
jgi:intracellular multiplication protein IcmO